MINRLRVLERSEGLGDAGLHHLDVLVVFDLAISPPVPVEEVRDHGDGEDDAAGDDDVSDQGGYGVGVIDWIVGWEGGGGGEGVGCVGGGGV